MDYRRYADVVHDEPPPSYEDQYEHELAATSVFELSDRRMLVSELGGNHVLAELEALAVQTNNDPLGREMSQASYPDSSEIDERGAGAAERPPASVDAQILPWTLNTLYPPASVPSMASGGQSHNSSPSPISPVTPNVNGICSTQLHPDANRTASNVSPLEGFMPNDIYWPRPTGMDPEWGHPSQASLLMPMVASPVGNLQEIAQQQVKGFGVRRNDYLRSSAPFNLAHHDSNIAGIQSPLASSSSSLECRSQRHDATGLRFGTYEHSDDQGWRYCGGYEQDASNDGRIERHESAAHQPEYAHRFGGSQGPSTNYIELEDHQDPQFCEAPEQNEVDSPLAHCDQCGKSFRGR